MEKENSRALVLEILLAVTQEKADSSEALGSVLGKYQYLKKRERSFITRVVMGTLERQIELDYLLDQFSTTKTKRMKPVILCILRSAVYELLYMDRVPDYAVIDEAVKLAGKKGFGSLKGFVNGVLRTIDRQKEKLPYPKETEELTSLSVRDSLPMWLIKRWLSDYDLSVIRKMGEDFLTEKPLYIRYDPARMDREILTEKLEKEGVTVRPVKEVPGALKISGFDYLESLPSFQEGDYFVQDVSAMMPVLVSRPKANDHVLDVCAAPGGKALLAAQMLQGTGRVEARDISEARLDLVRENAARCHEDGIRTRVMDAREDHPEDHGKWDIVLADLPCSGLGTLGKKPEIKYRVKEDALTELAALQRQILSTVQAYVKPGGKLVYSTCTIDREENEDNTRWFLKTFPEFTLEKEEQRLPGIQEGDGFYLALFDKKLWGRKTSCL